MLGMSRLRLLLLGCPVLMCNWVCVCGVGRVVGRLECVFSATGSQNYGLISMPRTGSRVADQEKHGREVHLQVCYTVRSKQRVGALEEPLNQGNSVGGSDILLSSQAGDALPS